MLPKKMAHHDEARIGRVRLNKAKNSEARTIKIDKSAKLSIEIVRAYFLELLVLF